ncbi:helix-turn-helix domain-containing protein [Allokutzneria sp. A3M-2-11 16]|uniref:helix-turn-helix domain-containing protein n=1 Tax=Allokutzneria sp. A3M-2-11 16 TaxID=2962043 RepID=UPI0020B88B73|nr:helix-turn-helix domain-containing protein [Allokutzneria sp. A3M-2-11 16]MCP3803885.1 helix-turn-helix domain-containing protein [Allokutzneria sp. A3M-2-11 16]
MALTGRYCMKCGGRLSHESRPSLCARCRQLNGVGSDHAPNFGPDFWHTDQMRDVFATRDMGEILRAYRYHPTHGHRPLSQETLSRWLGTVTQSQLSRIESGRNKVDTLEKLIHYAQALKMPEDLLWFKFPESFADRNLKPASGVIPLPGGPLVPAASLHLGSELANSLLGTLDRYSATDNLAGPQSLVNIVPEQLRFIDELVATARGKDRVRLLWAGSRYAEFAGWIYQDTGSLHSAMQISSAALDYARESEDASLSSYVLMRRSNIATDAGRPELALKLADEALAESGKLSPRQRAVALRQRAHAHALLGNADACTRALEEAHECAGSEIVDDNDIAQYCTPEYIEMEAAHCWIELGQAQKAIDALQRGLSTWPSEFRRDLGLGLARLAVAYAAGEQVEHSIDVAGHALQIARETGSFRTEKQLARIPSILVAHGATDEARQFDLWVKSLRK